MIVPLVLFAQLAPCGAAVNIDTLAAVARAESRFDSAAINDNTAHRRYSGLSDAQATATATRLLAAGHSLDLGLMQVNSANLHGLGLSVPAAFEPCKSIAAGARVLVDGYRSPGVGIDAQPAIYRALSYYNTGSPLRGFGNGYVARVQASAEQIVPAIRLAGAGASALDASAPAAVPPAPPPPPSWDVFATARYARQQKEAARSAPSTVAPSAAPATLPEPAALAPVQLRAINQGQAGER